MKKKMNRPHVLLFAACLCGALTISSSYSESKSPPKETFFKVEEFGADVALNGLRFADVMVLGPTGMKGLTLNDNLVVREIEQGSPAAGVMVVNDVIRSINDIPLSDNPLKTFGEHISASEAAGVMTLGIIRDGKTQTVELKLQKMPPFSKSWPYDCEKSKQILKNAARFIASRQNPDGGFDTTEKVAYGMAGLTLLATDDPEYHQNVRRLLQWCLDSNQPEDPEGPSWGNGYMGIMAAEYYLATGDRSILPVCQAISDQIALLQDPRGGWTHGGPGGHWYVQGGIMNPAGASCWLALELFEECGIHHKKTLELARHFFMRFVDNGTLPYGDHHPEFNGSGNSKDALACLALSVKGEQKSAELFGRIVTDFPESRVLGHTGGFLGFTWGNVAGANNPHRPDYLRTLHYWGWMLDVGRRWDGGFLLPNDVCGYMLMGPTLNTGATALVYGVPGKALRIFGKQKSVFRAEKLSRSLEKGKKLYQERNFDALRKSVKADTEDGRQLLRAADMKKRDIALSLKAAHAALENMNPLQARSIATTLDAMCEGQIAECKALIAEADSDKYKAVVQAGKAYDQDRWLVCTTPEARKNIEKIAADKGAGVYQGLAKELLSKPSDASEWIFSSAYLYQKYWPSRETSPVAMAVLKRLAHIKGSNWTVWHPMRWLRENGHIKDTFVDEWTAILPCSGLNDGKHAVEFSHYPIEPAATGEGFVPAPSADWTSLGYDDSTWRKATGPYTNTKDSQLKRARGTTDDFYRIKFKIDNTDFSELKLYIQHVGRSVPAVVYLNGKCVAWVEPARAKTHEPAELTQGAVKHLVKGENVLAIRMTGCDVAFDIGLYGNK